MRSRVIVLAVVAAASMTALSTAPAGAALPAYHRIAVYEAGLSSVGSMDIDGRSLYAISGSSREIGARLTRFDLDTTEPIWRLKLICGGCFCSG